MTVLKTDNWDSHKEVRELIERVKPLNDLYIKLGYSPYLDRESERILKELESLIRVEILGIEKFNEFQKYLTEKHGFYEKNPAEKNKLSAEEWIYIENLLSNKEDYQKIIELLNENQLWQKHLQHYSYNYLFTKKGHMINIIHFMELLDKLKEIFNQGWLPLSKKHYQTVLYKIDEVRNKINDAAKADAAYVAYAAAYVAYAAAKADYAAADAAYAADAPAVVDAAVAYADAAAAADAAKAAYAVAKAVADTVVDADVLHSLEDEVRSACVTLYRNEETCEKKRTLDDLLWKFNWIKHEYKPADEYFIEGVKEQTQIYLDSSWMHIPWLTTYIISHLLKGEIARLPKIETPSEKVGVVTLVGVVLSFYFKQLSVLVWLWFAVLILWYFFYRWSCKKTNLLLPIHEEATSGHYDGEELARRLRQLENKGIFVQSIIYSLLHL